MLSYALAIAVAISSLILFSTAFLMSKIHRKDDFLWGAVGLFYALVLWYCARNITGTVLLGQAAASALVVSYSWQIIKLRRAMQRGDATLGANPLGLGGSHQERPLKDTASHMHQEAISNPTQAAETSSFSVVRSINNLWQRKKPQIQSSATPMTKEPLPKVTEENIAIPETPAEISEQTEQTNKVKTVAKDTNKDTNILNPKPATSEISDEHENQVSNPVVTAPLPLPNKLPEVPQVDETKISQDYAESETGQVIPENIPENIPAPKKTENLSETIPQKIQDQTSAKEANPTPEKVSGETAKSPKPKSDFDSLETVEVAEVLEAESDRLSNNRESDRFNIIEVTTTEVKVTKEVIKPEQNQDTDADLEDLI